MTTKTYSSYMEIDLNAVTHNTRLVIERTGKPLMAVVKANAYGFGAVAIARACERGGAASFAVARLAEALELREAGIDKDILVFTLMDADEYRQALEQTLIISVFRFDQLVLLASLSQKLQIVPKIHLKMNTGMNRLGFNLDELPALIGKIRELQLPIEGIFSHYANIDEDLDDPLNREQHERFVQTLCAFRKAGFNNLIGHMTNSAAAYNSPESYFDLIRMGSSLVGVNPFYYGEKPEGIQNAMVWKTRLISVRQVPAGEAFGYSQSVKLEHNTLIGVIPVGYADGFHRVEGNEVLICGKRQKVVGSICADVSFVVLDDAYPVDEEVILIGGQGDTALTIELLADKWHTTRADVTSGISSRVGRIYKS